MVGNMFVSEDSQIRNEKMRSHNPSLLALYEIIHLNRIFITTLAHYQTEEQLPQVPAPAEEGQQVEENKSTSSQPEDNLRSVNLLVTFLEYISIAMQDTKSDVAHNNVTLCFIILACVTEDQYATALMHDPNLVFKVKLHRTPMRHRKAGVDTTPNHGRSLVCALLDLMIEFIRCKVNIQHILLYFHINDKMLRSHLMKRLPIDLHLLALSCIHRLLVYQKRCR